MMRRYFALSLVIGLILIAGCSSADETTDGNVSPVNTPDDDQVGESILERETDRI